ncbi:SidG protein, substrate of the Dot/Icm system [Legionella gratiana]|uniref:Protein SidG n=1 Tax=Legionella gratiana TaxID=45066 RepID=A0A378J2S8_9GAMM|nr:hypothetical protein [Legionella gratiana]KTD14618.1 SidG protein, substrate of the Dot/Icm system [Legionella gratiana]STX41696.1 protein SidG [Legionella gratiana]
MFKYDPSLHHVKIQFWGTKEKTSNGIDNFVEQELFGGNCGHVSIVMSLPINEETKKWIATYCYEQTYEQFNAILPNLTIENFFKIAKQRIPTTHIQHSTHSAKYNKEMFEKTKEIVSNIEFAQIEFSWWPSKDENFFLSDTDEDMVDERKGRSFNYSKNAKEYLHPEERMHAGKLGAQIMTYAPSVIVHQRDLSDTQVKKINIGLQLERINEYLGVKDLLISKINAMNTFKVEGSLTLICKNIGLKSDALIRDYLEKNPGKVAVQKFKIFFLKKVEEHIKTLEEQETLLKKELETLEHEEFNSEYITKGIPPDHVVTLPFLTDDRRGLSPEAMLKKMREVTNPNAPKFDLHTKNCSKITTDILTAGADHDPLLKHALSGLALGFFGTPQQVLSNVQTACAIIAENKKNTLLTRIANISFLQEAMGNLISIIMDQEASRGKKFGVGTALILVALARLPTAIIKIVLAPSETIGHIISGVSMIWNHAHSATLKAVAALASIIALVALAPFALVEQGIKHISKPFHALARWMSKKTSPPSVEDQVTNGSYRSMMTELINEEVAQRIQENTLELPRKKTPLEILVNFETAFQDNPDKVITLSDKDFDKINKYVGEKKDSALRLQSCCNESLQRANRLSIKPSKEVDALFREKGSDSDGHLFSIKS